MARKPAARVPADLRPRLEAARLDSLALMRALDRLQLADHLVEHPVLRALMELDADCAEALAVMDRPPTFPIDWRAMIRDTETSLRRLPAAREQVRHLIAPAGRPQLLAVEPVLRASLDATEAYNGLRTQAARIR